VTLPLYSYSTSICASACNRGCTAEPCCIPIFSAHTFYVSLHSLTISPPYFTSASAETVGGEGVPCAFTVWAFFKCLLCSSRGHSIFILHQYFCLEITTSLLNSACGYSIFLLPPILVLLLATNSVQLNS
jgi:hypothetical protein